MLGQGQTSWIREMDLSWGLLGWLVLVRASIMDSEEVGEIVFVSVATSVYYFSPLVQQGPRQVPGYVT